MQTTAWQSRRLLAALLLAGALLPGLAKAQLSEAEAKIALVFNLISFVEWPKELQRLTLCSIGSSLDDYAAALRSLDGSSAAGKPLRERRLETTDTVRGCQILFIADARVARARKWIEEAGPGALTIVDLPEGLQTGAMVAIGLEEQRLAFHLNQSAARQAGLGFSSRVLRLARSVR